MNEYDLLRAIGDINEKYIENAVVEEGTKVDFAKATPDVPARGRRKELIYIAVKRRKIQRMIVVATVLIIFVSAGVFVYWLLQREKGSTVDDGKTRGDHYSVSCRQPPLRRGGHRLRLQRDSEGVRRRSNSNHHLQNRPEDMYRLV